MSRGPGTPSRDFTRVVLCSSRMISMQSSTHSSQMNTVGPAISLRTSCWLLPQNEQYSVFLESLVPSLLILISVRRSIPLLDRPIPVRDRSSRVDRANSVPEKTLTHYTRANHGLLESPAIISDPLQPTMLTPDYQEFANRARNGHRDNTVIFRVRTGCYERNRASVALLPRRGRSTKAELSAYARTSRRRGRSKLP